MDTLPITRQEMDILLAALKDCEIFYTDVQKWKQSARINRIHQKLQVNLNRYEEVKEDE